ncbi:MAG: hypothetical protein ACLP05_09445 [Candidatus Kryptoniota bacterium]
MVDISLGGTPAMVVLILSGKHSGIITSPPHSTKENGIDYMVDVSKAVDRRPGKLPGASEVYVKLIFSTYSHTLLGAQMYGGDSVGELINLVSVMILNRMTDTDINTLQIGTHPLVTPLLVVYPVINASINAIVKWFRELTHDWQEGDMCVRSHIFNESLDNKRKGDDISY